MGEKRRAPRPDLGRDPAGPQLAAATGKANALHSCVDKNNVGTEHMDRWVYSQTVGTNSAGGAMVLLNANVSTSDVC